jgi:hypothetical protein
MKHGPAPKIDPEGVCRFNAQDELVPSRMTECHRIVFHTAVATAINVRRIVREQVAGRLEALEKAVADTHEQLARIERKLDQLLQASADADGS